MEIYICHWLPGQQVAEGLARTWIGALCCDRCSPRGLMDRSIRVINGIIQPEKGCYIHSTPLSDTKMFQNTVLLQCVITMEVLRYHGDVLQTTLREAVWAPRQLDHLGAGQHTFLHLQKCHLLFLYFLFCNMKGSVYKHKPHATSPRKSVFF